MQSELFEYGTFDLNKVEGKFYVESVYDGDTITLVIPTKLSIYNMCSSNTIDINSDTNKSNKIILNKVKVRLFGIDTPELKPKKDLVTPFSVKFGTLIFYIKNKII